MAEEFHSGICSGSWWNSLKSTGVDGPALPVSVPVPSVGFGWTGDKQRSCDESVSGSSVSFQYDNQKVASLPMVTGGFIMDPSLPVTGFGLSSPMDWNQALINSGGRANDQTSFHESFYNQESKASMDSNHIHMGSINVENTTPNLFKDINNFQAFMANQQHHLSSGNESTDSVSFPENLSVSYGSPSPVFLQGLPLDQLPQQHGNYANNSYNQIASSEMVMNLNPCPSPNWSTKIPQFSNTTPFWNAPLQTQFLPHDNFESKPNATTMPTKTSSEGVRDSSSVTKKGSSEPAFKKPRMETPSPLPTFKVRKEKLSDRVTALQQLVSPFGKTDTASVLYEAIEYIKFLHDQVNVLSTQYLKNGHPMQHQQNPDELRDGEGPKQDLRSRGLCLVPLSSTFPVANEPISDFWTPSFGGYYR